VFPSPCLLDFSPFTNPPRVSGALHLCE
jgi:hypothetical protein